MSSHALRLFKAALEKLTHEDLLSLKYLVEDEIARREVEVKPDA